MSSEKKNGYELACRVLQHPDGGVEALLRLAGNDESCWLEMKAGMELLPEDKQKEKPVDLYWNIAKAAISIMNTSGGVLLIGIQDKPPHNAVPLEDNDPRHVITNSGLEAYRRQEILERIWPDKKEWKTSRGIWFIDPVPEADLVEVVGCRYQGENIAAVLLKPASKCIHCIRRENNIEEESVLAREPGQTGKVREIRRSAQMQSYESEREIATLFLGTLYDRFEQMVMENSEAGKITQAIRDYYTRFAESVRRKRCFELSCFTPLEGSGTDPSEMEDFMSPEAEEIWDPLESDDWLDPKNGDGDQDDDSDDSEFDPEDEEDEEDDEDFRERRSGDLITLMKEIPRMLVLGEPGGGKTTTLLNFTLLFQNNDDTAESPVLAVYIPMGQWHQGGSIEQLLNKSTGLSPEQLAVLIRQDRLRLVIDAFNECPDMYKKAAALNICSFLREHPELPVVISSRTDQDLKELKLPMFTVEPMDREHQKIYLQRYLNDEAAAEDLFSRLNAMSGGSELAANPMLLRLIVEIFRESHELPAGRAGLYHQWLKQWYVRENKKAEAAGIHLKWDFDSTLDILSELALQGRLQGYRDIPLDFAENTLQEYGPDCIEKLCQGPVVMIDEDFVRFRHETFQEYLCAEKLIRQPERLVNIEKKDFSQWMMVLAYAAELKWPLPDALWQFAWKIDPWLGVALTDEKQANEITDDNFTGLRPEYHGQPISFVNKKNDIELNIYYHALTGSWDKIIDNDIAYDIQPILKQMFSIAKYLEYVILTKKEIEERWILFELWLLSFCSWLGPFFNIYRYLIAIKHSSLLKQRIILDFIQDYYQTANISNQLKSKLKQLVSKFKKWIKHTNILFFISTALENRIITKEYLDLEKLKKRIHVIKPKDTFLVMELGLATKEDFIEKIAEWTANATPEQANQLIRSGLAIKEDFVEKKAEWIVTANSPWQAAQLIRLGLATKEDFADKIAEWTAIADRKNAHQLIQSGLVTKENFADKKAKWIVTANSLGQAARLIRLGLATKEDFADKKAKWIAVAGPKKAHQLIEMGWAAKEDFVVKKEEWIANAVSRKQKARLLQWGFVTESELNSSSQIKQTESPENIINRTEETFPSREPDTETATIFEHNIEGDRSMGSYPLFANESVMHWTARTIYSMCSTLNKPAKFEKTRPEKWDLDIEFFRSNSEKIQKIASCLYSLIDLNQNSSTAKYLKKEKVLIDLLDSDPHFECIKQYPVTMDPKQKKASPAPNQPPEKKAEAPASDVTLFSSKKLMLQTYKVLRKMMFSTVLAKPQEFKRIRPSNWNFDISFCQNRKEDLSKICAMLQGLSDRCIYPASEKYQKRLKELKELLDSEQGFQCLKLHPVTYDPDEKKNVLTPGRTKTPVPQKTKAPAKKKPSNNSTVKNKVYDPEIDFETGLSAVGRVTSFSRDADHIRIYIDEVWPGAQGPEYDDIGVISGIVWLGKEKDFEILPWIKTHTRSEKPFFKAVNDLLDCGNALPFVFPIFHEEISQKDYPELLRITLITLLGWILPQDGKDCDVKIYCEGISSSGMEPGKNNADSFKEIRNTIGLTTDRMKRWHISEFISMKEKKEDKEFEYIPYADAVGYLTSPIQKAWNFAKQFHVEDWPGYVPLSRDLLKHLVGLDSNSPAGYADELFEFARNRQKTKLFFYVLEQAIQKADSDPEFKYALFEKLEKMFEAKQRDLPLLNHICGQLVSQYPLEEFSGCPRQKLIRILVELQNANHAGDPEKAAKCIELYRDSRNELFEQDPNLCAYTDMNLAVHYNDRFEFEKAAEICRQWENHAGFDFLLPENKGRILSSIGQSCSISGDFGKAEEYFRRAIDIFRNPANPLPEQADHTAVYMAMNALDAGNFNEAVSMAENVFQCSFAEAIAKYADNLEKPFHHHLLVKNLYFNPEVRTLRSVYLSSASEWTGEEQHPWELIELYRILLLNVEGKTDECRDRFTALNSLYAELGDGVVMQLLKAFALTACELLGIGDPAFLERQNLLDQAEKKLPATAQICRKLRSMEKLDPDFWRLLPFNYK